MFQLNNMKFCFNIKVDMEFKMRHKIRFIVSIQNLNLAQFR